MVAASMTARLVLNVAVMVATFALIGTVAAFAAAAPQTDDEIVEEVGRELGRAMGHSIPVGLAAAFLWGGPVFGFKKFLADPANNKWTTWKFGKTLIVGIAAAMITVFIGVDFKTSLEISLGFGTTYGLTAILDKLVNAGIVRWELSKKK